MKKYLLFILCLVISTSFLFCGCKDETKTFKMPTSETISSNGGFIVSKGEYVYFFGGYEKYTTATSSKLDVGTSAIYKATRDENGELKDIEKFVNKVCGYEYGGIYIFGDYMYYATPETGKNKSGEVQNYLLKIMRVKLDGTGTQQVYRSSDEFTSSDWWEMASVKGKTFVVVYEDNKIKKVDVSGNKFETKTIVSENVSSAVFANDCVVFTETVADKNGLSTNGNKIKSVNIFDNSVELYKDCTTVGKSATLKKFLNGHIVYTFEGKTYACDLSNKTELKLFDGVMTSVYFADNKLIFGFNSELYVKDFYSGELVTTDDRITHENVTVMEIVGDYVVYSNNSKMYKKSYKGLSEEEEELASIGTISTSLSKDYDIFGDSDSIICFLATLEDETESCIYMYDAEASKAYTLKYDSKSGLPVFSEVTKD